MNIELILEMYYEYLNTLQSQPHYYNGGHTSGDLSEFVHEILRPSVINLDTRMFKQLVENKPEVCTRYRARQKEFAPVGRVHEAGGVRTRCTRNQILIHLWC